MPKILLIDDAATIRDSLRQLLEPNGFEVVEADNGEKGLELMSQGGIDLAISDLNMPGMDGLTMCRHVQAQRLNIPIFMLTTQTSTELKAKAKEVGVVAWIVKPHKDEVMLKGIQKVLKMV